MEITSALEIIGVGILVPLLILTVNQVLAHRRSRASELRRELAVANAILGDLKALRLYISQHIARLDQKILTKSSSPVREIKFLQLSSGFNDGQTLHEVGLLAPAVAHKIMNFYAHLQQNNIILNIVVENWEQRTKKQSGYQLENLTLLGERALETIQYIESHYQELAVRAEA